MKKLKKKNKEAFIDKSKGYIYILKHDVTHEYLVAAYNELLKEGEIVIAETNYGLDHHYVVGRAHDLLTIYKSSCNCDSAQVTDVDFDENSYSQNIPSSLLYIQRVASAEDKIMMEENRSREAEVKRVVIERANYYKLDMKYLMSHFLTANQRLMIYFSAEKRIDFRDLVRDLGSHFKMRIELRQLKPREMSRLVGGLGICGRNFCCKYIKNCLSDSISLKMAKEQNLSLNTVKISGPCGRLLCCIAYEYDIYLEEKKYYPNSGHKVLVGKDLMKVSDINIINSMVHLVADKRKDKNIQFDNLNVPFSSLEQKENQWKVSDSYYNELLV